MNTSTRSMAVVVYSSATSLRCRLAAIPGNWWFCIICSGRSGWLSTSAILFFSSIGTLCMTLSSSSTHYSTFISYYTCCTRYTTLSAILASAAMTNVQPIGIKILMSEITTKHDARPVCAAISRKTVNSSTYLPCSALMS